MQTIIRSIAFVLVLTAACNNDDTPTRPEDGTVQAWESCAWDGQVMSALCDPELVCTTHGICAPTCTTVNDCPTFDGFEMECSPNEGLVCQPKCNAAEECPKTGGAELHCLDFYCVGDPSDASESK